MLRKASFVYYKLNRDTIDRLKADDCIVTDRVRGSRLEPPYNQHGVTIQGVNHRRLERNRRVISQLERKCAEVDKALADMDDPELKMSLMLKFQDGLTWKEVGHVLRREGETLRKRAERYFDKIEPQ